MMLRIIGGTLRGRSLKIPPSSLTRPSSDRGREAVFNILTHQFMNENGLSILQNAFVIDLFAGSGAFGIETLSRGASFCVFVEKDPQVLSVLEKNIFNFMLKTQSLVMNKNALFPFDLPPHLEERKFDLIFLDPPYGKGFVKESLMVLMKKNYLSPTTLIIAEMEKGKDISFITENFLIQESRVYGKSHFLFFKLKI